MDAFAISICKGLSMKEINWKKTRVVSTYFSIFQAIMPIIGYFLGSSFDKYLISFDHWIIFSILSIIGVNMIKDAFKEQVVKKNDNTDFKTMIVLAIATSIDALAVGVTFAFLDSNIIIASSIIGIVTFVLSFIGVIIGNKFGYRYQEKSEIFGGVILIIIGIKILLEHLLQ